MISSEMISSNVHRLMSVMLAAALALAATAAEPAQGKPYVDPNAYARYEAAMAPKPGDPMAVEWQKANEAAIRAATAPEALAAHVKDAAAAKALLAKVKGAYASDPMALTVAAAVTQFVVRPDDCGWLCSVGRFFAFWRTCPRTVWTEARLSCAEASGDVYVKMFCLDQLRWCGCAGQADAVRLLGEKAGDRAVNEFAALVARELAR